MTTKTKNNTLNNIPDPQNTMKLNTRKRVQLNFTKPSLTKQSFKDECNINNIVARFAQTGQLPLNTMPDPQYGDCPNLDLKESLDLVNSIKEEFNELPDEIRKSFKNYRNYAQFLSDYEADPASFDAYFDSSSNSSDEKPQVTSEAPVNEDFTPKKSPD